MPDGMFRVTNNLANTPVGSFNGKVFVSKTSQGGYFQIAIDVGSQKLWYRTDGGSGWGNWTLIATATPPTEHLLPLINGWVQISEHDPLKYGMCGDGKAQIFGVIFSPVGAVGDQVIATLPVGYRPIDRSAWLSAIDGTTGAAYPIVVAVDGNVRLWQVVPPAGRPVVLPVQTFYAATDA